MCDSVPLQSDTPGAILPAKPPSAQRAERLRVQELLRYFQVPKPFINNERPRVALDTSLSAFAQLSALRLDCQRSFISLMDHDTQYIIAEATRTISLETGETDAGPDEAIYLGATNLDIFWGVCPNTISVFSCTDDSMNIVAPYVKANQSYYVMNDLSKVPGYETRPYIIGWPYMRYYAEVPIRSPSGLVIGSLCVVDNKPREGLDSKGISILEEISHAVMDHLDLVMSKVQRKRAERMIQGLGLFLEGSDSLREWWIESERNSHVLDPSQRRLTIHEQADREFGPQRISNLNISGSSKIEDAKGEREVCDTDLYSMNTSKQMLTSKPSTDPGEPISMTPKGESLPREFPKFRENQEPNSNTRRTETKFVRNIPKDRQASTKSGRQNQLKLRSGVEPMLARAANLIREAVSLNGVAFFEPPIGVSRVSNDGNRQRKSVARKSSVPSMTSGATEINGRTVSNEFFPVDVPSNVKPCKILAYSTKLISEEVGTSDASLDMPEEMLRLIVEKFPQGGILEYDKKGSISYDPLELAWYQNIPMARKITSSNKVLRNYSMGPSENDAIEANFLRNLLPGVRSIILFPLWNMNRDRLFAYNMVWTTDGNRVFQREDFAYLASFCNSITSELSRLDTVAADQAKANFISSISHELRSPLHGVLASTELLQTLTRDPTSIEIINTIETCGSTLLDTMESLLTFAKINEAAVSQQEKDSLAITPSLGQSEPQPPKGLTLGVDLALLVEDVMNANISGHQFRKSLEKRSSNGVGLVSVNGQLAAPEEPVTVVCDIDAGKNWMFATQPGIWKRIVINLFGNSLKYSDSGFIYVKLSQEIVLSDGARKTFVCLRVEDSGRGISDEYMKYHLFTPFQQENPLCPGTGLGLSIVHQLVESINGTIKVESKTGYGTRIEVKVALESLSGSENHVAAQGFYSERLSQLKFHKVGLVGFDSNPEDQESTTDVLGKQVRTKSVVKSSLIRAMEEGFGFKTVNVNSLDSNSENVDFLMTTESYFRVKQSANNSPRTLPLIILCSEVALDYRTVSHINGPVSYLSQPFGPRKLARALENFIQYLDQEATLEINSPRISTKYMGTNVDTDKLSQTFTTSLQASDPISAATSDGTSQENKLPRVLLVEDNPINLKVLATFLGKLGYPYAIAKDGLQALETYESASGSFAIIFMDIQMPNMNGMTASYEIREYEQQNSLNRTPIIALTGLAGEDAQEEAAMNGIDLFLTKPVSLKKLKTVLESYFPSPDTGG